MIWRIEAINAFDTIFISVSDNALVQINNSENAQSLRSPLFTLMLRMSEPTIPPPLFPDAAPSMRILVGAESPFLPHITNQSDSTPTDTTLAVIQLL